MRRGVRCVLDLESISGMGAARMEEAIKQILDWVVNPPIGASVKVKTLAQEGLHTWYGILGYLMKDRDRPWFRIIFRRHVSHEDLLWGIDEYAVYGAGATREKSELNNHNIFMRVGNWVRAMAEPIDWDFFLDHPELAIREMLRSGRFYPSAQMVIAPAAAGAGLDYTRFRVYTRVMLDPSDVEMEDVLSIFFPSLSPQRKDELMTAANDFDREARRMPRRPGDGDRGPWHGRWYRPNRETGFDRNRPNTGGDRQEQGRGRGRGLWIQEPDPNAGRGRGPGPRQRTPPRRDTRSEIRRGKRPTTASREARERMARGEDSDSDTDTDVRGPPPPARGSGVAAPTTPGRGVGTSNAMPANPGA